MKIAIDLGHGVGSDRGAVGNIAEEEIIDSVGNLVIFKLKTLGHTVIEVRPKSAISVNDSLAQRVNKANSNNVNLYVSIHANAGGGVGTEVFTYKAKELAEARVVLNNIVNLGFNNRGIKDGSGFYVIRNSKSPAMLIEICFVDSSDVYKYNSIGAEAIANAIVQGLIGETNDWKLGWNQNFIGWWYCTDLANKYYYKDCWKEINGEWYSFDLNGYARKSTWLKDKGYWYYLKDSCKMAKNEWLWIDGECYCFGDTGGLYVNTITPDGYRVDETGAWIQ